MNSSVPQVDFEPPSNSNCRRENFDLTAMDGPMPAYWKRYLITSAEDTSKPLQYAVAAASIARALLAAAIV